jgi:16S rRNA (cytidine1402-2'-O)-methyltransferase
MSGMAKPLEAGLYITSTPIGHARDISLRALDTLANCDAILAEDTRVTAKLLAIHGISRPLISYNDHNAPRVRPQILMRLGQGKRLALVSDSGTPLVSDPGYKLVRESIAAGVEIHVVPGASAAISALVVSGLPTNRFLFVGFLPRARDSRRSTLEKLKPMESTLIFFEAPQRLVETLEEMRCVFHDRDAAVARELTKLHENVRRGNLQDLASFYANSPARGEVTIILGPPETEEPDFENVDRLLEKALAFMPVRAAAELVSEALELPRKAVYARALLRKQAQTDGD